MRNAATKHGFIRRDHAAMTPRMVLDVRFLTRITGPASA